MVRGSLILSNMPRMLIPSQVCMAVLCYNVPCGPSLGKVYCSLCAMSIVASCSALKQHCTGYWYGTPQNTFHGSKCMYCRTYGFPPPIHLQAMIEKINNLLTKTIKAPGIQGAQALVAMCPGSLQRDKMIKTLKYLLALLATIASSCQNEQAARFKKNS